MTKISKYLSCLILLTSICTGRGVFAQSKDEYIEIVKVYEQWKNKQFKSGKFATEEKCKRDTVMKENYKGPEIGIPGDINISFTDINGDSKIDGMITFQPDQCDGGNALMNAQIRLLILSRGAAYSTDETYLDKIEGGLKKGWINVKQALGGTIYGTYYEYKSSDGRCCPSIKRDFSIDFKTKKLTFDN